MLNDDFFQVLGTRRPVPPYKPLPAGIGNATTQSPERDQPESNAVLDVHQSSGKPIGDDHANHSAQLRPSVQQQYVTPTRKYQSTLRTDNNAVSDNTLVLGGFPLQPQPIPNDTSDDDEPKPVVPLNTGASSPNTGRSTVNHPLSSIGLTSICHFE